MQIWLFLFASLGAIASTVKILEYFGIKPQGPSMSAETGALLWGLAFLALSAALAYSSYANGKLRKRPTQYEGVDSSRASLT